MHGTYLEGVKKVRTEFVKTLIQWISCPQLFTMFSSSLGFNYCCRLDLKMGYNIDDKMVEEISWLVSGEEDETNMSLEQSFDKLKSLILFIIFV